MVGMLKPLAGLAKSGIARLAGFYSENPVGHFLGNTALDVGAGAAMGVPLGMNVASSIGTGIGSSAGMYLGRKLGGETGALIGSIAGSVAGTTGGSMIADAAGLGYDAGTQPTERPGNPDSAQSDPMVSRQQMMMASLPPDQIRKMQEQAIRKAAIAQYQSQAFQQYGGYGQ